MFKLLKWGAIGFISLIVILAVADGIRNLSETDSETFERHINANHLESAENILSDNPNLEIDGEKATDILSKAKAEAEANRVAKEKAEAERAAKEKIKKEAEQLELAKSQGYNSYDEYLKVELKKAREREAKKKEKEIVETTENLSTVNYQTIFEQSLIDYYNIFSEDSKVFDIVSGFGQYGDDEVCIDGYFGESKYKKLTKYTFYSGREVLRNYSNDFAVHIESIRKK